MSFQYEKDKGSDSNVSLYVTSSLVLFVVLVGVDWYIKTYIVSTFPFNILVGAMLLFASFISVGFFFIIS